MKKIILAVTNDLVTDQRVHRIATTLASAGASVMLIGRKLPRSAQLQPRPYKTYRLKLLFHRGFLFYAFYNFRLFLYLLFHSADIIVSNDLDTLAACFLASRLKRSKLIYDSHEYFTEVPELVDRTFVRKTWAWLEKKMLPEVKFSYTVNSSLSHIYSEKYGISMEVVRNLPLRNKLTSAPSPELHFHGKKILLYQGALNMGRGLEMLIDSMQFLDSCILVLVGDGDVSDQLKERVKLLNLESSVKFTGRIPFENLSAYTSAAFLGLSVEENLGLNYYFSLPNKLFDYIQAGIPIVCSNFPEMKSIINQFHVGCLLNDRSPQAFAKLISEIINDESTYSSWKSNLLKAAEILSWENEEQKLLSIYRKAGLLF